MAAVDAVLRRLARALATAAGGRQFQGNRRCAWPEDLAAWRGRRRARPAEPPDDHLRQSRRRSSCGARPRWLWRRCWTSIGAPVIEEAGERAPPFETVVDGLACLAIFGGQGALRRRFGLPSILFQARA